MKIILQKRKQVSIAVDINRAITKYGANPDSFCYQCGQCFGESKPLNHICGEPDHPWAKVQKIFKKKEENEQ